MHAEWNIRAAEGGQAHAVGEAAALDAAEADGFAMSSTLPASSSWRLPLPVPPDLRARVPAARGGCIGEVEHVAAILRMPAPPDSDPRWSRGARRRRHDGPRVLQPLRPAAARPGRRWGADSRRRASEERPGTRGVDERLLVEVGYPSGATGAGGSDMSAESRDVALVVRGTAGEIVVPMFPVPHEGDSRATVEGGPDTRRSSSISAPGRATLTSSRPSPPRSAPGARSRPTPTGPWGTCASSTRPMPQPASTADVRRRTPGFSIISTATSPSSVRALTPASQTQAAA